MSRILIAGCGDVGIALGVALNADGHHVFGLRRNAAALPADVEPIRADLADAHTLAALPEVEYVFYTAAADGRDDKAYERAYVRGVNNVIDALTASTHEFKRFFFVSSTGVYAQDNGEQVDESSPTEPTRFSGKRLLQGEAACLSGPHPGTVVRFGGIYGPGRERLIREVKAGASCVENPPQFTNRIHRDDCAGVLRHLMSLDSPEQIYAGVDCEPAPRCAVLDWLAERLGAPKPVIQPADSNSGQGKRVLNARLIRSGYQFRYPTFREGYAQVIAALSSTGLEAQS